MSGYLESLDLSIDLGRLEDYKYERLLVISTILKYINNGQNKDKLILKGGTGLLLCHGLNRFSEDIDFEALRNVDGIVQDIDRAMASMGKSCDIRKTKDGSDSVRFMVDYRANSSRGDYPLKFDISFRHKRMIEMNAYTIQTINGFRVFSLADLVSMKIAAFLGRDKVRDFYDLAWCSIYHPDLFNRNMAMDIMNSLSYKGEESVFELLREEASSDHVMSNIDIDTLILSFLEVMEEKISVKSPTQSSNIIRISSDPNNFD